MNKVKIIEIAQQIRRRILEISYNCNKSAHLGGALSMVEIIATLYGSVLKFDRNNPEWEKRDRFILSKGHAALGLYSALVVSGLISEEVFNSYQTNESDLTTHPVMNPPLAIESSNGSLGQGLSFGVGLALSAKRKQKDYKTYVFLGDGECNEGSVWEAVMAASNYKLDNLIAIVDLNGYQNDGSHEIVMNYGDMNSKWSSFGWNVLLVDGHNVEEVHSALTNSKQAGMPTVVIAKTIKGKGVSFMENNNEWHHNRLTQKFYEQAIKEWEMANV